MKYSVITTAKKAVLPLVIIILVRAILATAASQGIYLDENVIWSYATAGYSALIALLNWLKNRKKKDI